MVYLRPRWCTCGLDGVLAASEAHDLSFESAPSIGPVIHELAGVVLCAAERRQTQRSTTHRVRAVEDDIEAHKFAGFHVTQARRAAAVPEGPADRRHQRLVHVSTSRKTLFCVQLADGDNVGHVHELQVDDDGLVPQNDGHPQPGCPGLRPEHPQEVRRFPRLEDAPMSSERCAVETDSGVRADEQEVQVQDVRHVPGRHACGRRRLADTSAASASARRWSNDASFCGMQHSTTCEQ